MRKLLIALILGCGASLVALPFCGLDPAAPPAGLTSFARTVELKTYDWRFGLTARPDTARRDIALVKIDEDSIRRLEPQIGRWPWPRLVHAYLINYLARGPAKVVAYDVLFGERDLTRFKVQGEDWTGEESDQAFVEAVSKAGDVVLAADATREEDWEKPSPDNDAARAARAALDFFPPAFRLDGPLEERPIIAPPFDDLARAARGLGHTFVALDADGPLRRSVPFIRVRGRAIPSLPVAAALVAGDLSPDRVRLDRDCLVFADARMPLIQAQTRTLGGPVRAGRRALVRFTGPAAWADGKTNYDEYSFFRLFYSEVQILAGERPMVDPAVFRGKVVVVGVTAAGLHDVFSVPFARGGGKMPGMEMHANVIDNILSGSFMASAPRWTTALAIVLASLVVGLACAFFNAWWTIGAALLVVAGLAGIGTALFVRGLWLPLVGPMFATTTAAFGGVAYQYLVEGREKRRIKRVFSRMVAPDVYAHLLSDPARTRLGGERREMSVLFSDIRGFTTVSESGRPEDIVAQLNEYFTHWVDVLFRHKGTVDKFVGDMVMALFSAPVEDADHADHAVQAALDMLRVLEGLNARWAREGRPCLNIGIGINTGEMVAGNVGSEQIMSYTVIGDAVNLGSRLESLNKQYGTSIIISEHTRRRLKGQYDIRALGEVTVKGKTQAVGIFEVRRDRGSGLGESGPRVGD